MDWSALGYPSLLTRVAIGKSVGLCFGLIGFFMAPQFHPEIEMYTRVGILLWYPTMGAFVGLFGVMNWHPILQLPLPWWFRSILVGGWMNLCLVFFAHQEMAEVLIGLSGKELSPFWFVLPGGVAGAVMGYVCTRFGGDGPETTAVLEHP